MGSEEIDEERSLGDLGGPTDRSPAMRRLVALAARVAPLDSTVLITGESGVGKERLARWIHNASPRSSRSFIAINCAALPEALLDSELFGHTRGAFTGALHDRTGLIESADRGTLFLDEVGDMTPLMQVRLLRVLQEREVRRIGETKSRPIDVRVLAATHRDLTKEVAINHFRQDLLYRLRVLELRIPALRERPEDIEPLACEILERISSRLKRPIEGFAADTLELLLQYAWPGNIRELEHAIERACALAAGPRIEVDDLPDEVCRSGNSQRHGSHNVLKHRDRVYVHAVLKRHGGRRVDAAKELGISLSTLKRRLSTERRNP